ncbi:hypothetical protein IP92_00967 [Pseudoduganella flava]|uniref:Carboxypeptidase regulatory-like domain-containing protein n=1 Tax=Pseudoduganella flava TaxID=871742 RepID=A0A562Q086_9BURK|nr:carboxypeptidase-like regulatory domain-containing protein [Pseudoduganella flava]QGZ38679.1 hypothetical protein GO485_06165 [Pseudoduganella flava]TWI49746.1 hypothetical protein IP92_00967 [Pseudoduganella flava]
MTTITAASGIAGEVILSPIMPVERPGDVNHRSCEAMITIVDAAGRAVATVRSGADGRFEIALAPGTYRLRPESGAAGPYAPQQTVVVTGGRLTPVRIVYDSGIR